MREGSSIREILFGVEEYLEFNNDEENSKYVRDFIKIIDSENFEKALLEYCLKQINESYHYKENFFRSIIDYKKKATDDSAISDAMSRSQIKSKIWLANELSKINGNYENIVLLAGWFGQLKLFLERKIF